MSGSKDRAGQPPAGVPAGLPPAQDGESAAREGQPEAGEPAGWMPEIEEIGRRRALALAMAGPRR